MQVCCMGKGWGGDLSLTFEGLWPIKEERVCLRSQRGKVISGEYVHDKGSVLVVKLV